MVQLLDISGTTSYYCVVQMDDNESVLYLYQLNLTTMVWSRQTIPQPAQVCNTKKKKSRVLPSHHMHVSEAYRKINTQKKILGNCRDDCCKSSTKLALGCEFLFRKCSTLLSFQTYVAGSHVHFLPSISKAERYFLQLKVHLVRSI